MTETLSYGYSFESTHQELSNEYQHDRVQRIFQNLCIHVLWTKVTSALEGLLLMKSSPTLYFLDNSQETDNFLGLWDTQSLWVMRGYLGTCRKEGIYYDRAVSVMFSAFIRMFRVIEIYINPYSAKAAFVQSTRTHNF